MQVKDLIKCSPDKEILGEFLVNDLVIKPFNNREGNYASLSLQDQTGKIQAKIWDSVDKIKDSLKNGDIIEIQGKTNQYQGKIQIIIENLRLSEQQDTKKFIPSSNKNVDILIQELFSIMDKIEDVDLKKLWDSFKADKELIKMFSECPGGKGAVHHTRLNGLLEHVLSILKIVEFLGIHYKLNNDVLRLGAFLHDIGKMNCYEYEFTIEMTDIGRLHGHSVPSYLMFIEKLRTLEIEEEKKKRIQETIGHLILSHHEKFEYQSPVIPMTKEAIILAKADAIDSWIDHVDDLLKIKPTNLKWTNFDDLTKQFYFETQLNQKITTRRKKIKGD